MSSYVGFDAGQKIMLTRPCIGMWAVDSSLTGVLPQAAHVSQKMAPSREARVDQFSHLHLQVGQVIPGSPIGKSFAEHRRHAM